MKMSNYLNFISEAIKNRQEKVENQQKFVSFSPKQIKIVLFINVLFVSILSFFAYFRINSSILEIFICIAPAIILMHLCTFNKTLTNNFKKATLWISLSTILGIAIGFCAYKMPLGERLETLAFQNFFEKHKLLIGNDYYNEYIMNKNDNQKLYLLREEINKEIGI